MSSLGYFIYFCLYVGPYLVFFIAPLLFVFAICVTFFSSNMSTGVKSKWPKRNIVGVSVFGVLLSTTLFVGIAGSLWYFVR